MKKYLSISEVSKLLDIEEHVIRYWDSKDPKTNKIRIDGISTKTKAGTRYFNRENIRKIQKLIDLLYENGAQTPSLPSISIANKFIQSNKKIDKSLNNQVKNLDDNKDEILIKINQILNKMRILAKL